VTRLMTGLWRFAAVGLLAASVTLALATKPSMAEPRAHVYLLRGLMNIFSLGMDTLAEELTRHGVYATVYNHTQWQALADQAAARYKAGQEGPIIIIGHSLGADAVMEMSAYLGQKGVPVALAVPFDGTQSFAASSNIQRVLNLTQRDYAYMRRGPGFKGTLVNLDVSSDPSIDHLNIDKSPRLHARVISEVLAIIGSHRGVPPAPGSTTPHPLPVNAPAGNGTPAPAPAPAHEPAKPEAAPARQPEAAPAAPAPSRTGSAASGADLQPVADSGTPVIAMPEHHSVPAAAPPPVSRKPVAPAAPMNAAAAQVPN
jgi:hypothetical protein